MNIGGYTCSNCAVDRGTVKATKFEANDRLPNEAGAANRPKSGLSLPPMLGYNIRVYVQLCSEFEASKKSQTETIDLAKSGTRS